MLSDVDRRGAQFDEQAGRWSFALWSPDSTTATVTVADRGGSRVDLEMVRSDDEPALWVGSIEAAQADRYWFTVDGIGPLLDPYATEVRLLNPDGGDSPPFTGLDRRTDGDRLSALRVVPIASLPESPWPTRPKATWTVADPVIYEMHVRGFERTFAGATPRLAYLAELGIDVIELMPVHPFDPTGNYWGYMPLVWGAVHERYAVGRHPADELADLVAAAHEQHLLVWVDVVFNHTAEEGYDGITTSWRAIADRHVYRFRGDEYVNDSGCGNDIDPASDEVRRLVLASLDRYADLGVDGFRFDLASLLARDGGDLVRLIGDWAEQRGVELVAEAWDMGSYLVGDGFPDPRWRQWNDRFRDDVRGFLRGEEGRVPGLAQRVAGSPDLFHGDAWRSVNFIDAHDGLTMHDLTTVTSDHHHSWDCGPQLRPQQLRNAFCLLLLSAGASMFVMGDEFARTQNGDHNPYDVDGPLTWVDWSRLEEWRDLHGTVQQLIALRREHVQGETGGPARVFGTRGPVDGSAGSRSLAWSIGSLYVMANAWWEPLEFEVQCAGPWSVALATAGAPVLAGTRITLAPRSTVVLVPGR